MLNPTPILEQPNIVRKLKVLNYAPDKRMQSSNNVNQYI
jgi:hypothetical protein